MSTRRAAARGAARLLLHSCLLAAVACASFELVQAPDREADLFPGSVGIAGTVVAVDAVTDSGRAERYFGVDLIERGIVPVQVIVSNHSQRRVVLRPADVLALRGREVVDPLPVERVAAMLKERGLFMSDDTEQDIDAFFESVSLRETIVTPGETVQGFLFLELDRDSAPRSRYFRRVSLFARPAVKLSVALSEHGGSERMHFGPFPVYVSGLGL